MDQVNAVAKRGETLPCEPEGFAVTVDTDQDEIREPRKERLRVSPHTERRVDQNGPGLGQRGGKQFDRALEENRSVQ